MALGPSAELPQEFLRREGASSRVPKIPEDRHEFSLQDLAVRFVRHEDVSEAVDSEPMEGDVVHFEVAVVVGPPDPR